MYAMFIVMILFLCNPALSVSGETAESLRTVSWSFHQCLNDRESPSDKCDEPEWRSVPVLIEFNSARSPAVSLALNLDGIDSSPELNYDSPALEIIVKNVTGAAINQEETYFTVQSDDYHKDPVELGDVKNTNHCDLPKQIEWTFDRSVRADEESSITVVFVIKGNEACTWLEIAKKFFEENKLLVIIGGSALLFCCCCFCCCCKGNFCNCLGHCLGYWLECFGCDCCGLFDCIGGNLAQKALEMV